MSPTQLFHIPTALKRTKPAAVTQKYQPDRRETKAEHILGVTRADINTRNRSISSSATNRLKGSLSDATTEFGTSLPRDGSAPQLPELHLRASSVLLHDDYIEPSSASSVQSSRLRAYDSNSTLHSHYDPSQAPLSISQQTSDSSRRDFALRKGLPKVVQKTKQPKEAMPELRFKRSRAKGEITKLSKERQPTGTSHVSLASSLRSDRKDTPESMSSHRVRFTSSVASPTSKSARVKNTLLEPLDPACVKVNVRKPKVGAKHWFDGHEGDSSEEESIDEPAFHDKFVTGLESAFQNGYIKPPSDTSTITNTIISSSLSSASTPKSSVFRTPKPEPLPPIPRIAVLSAKASKSSLLPPPSQHSAKRKADPLAKTDLNKNSVLNLSSSDDEDEPITPQRAEACPPIRDSVAIAFNNESQVELGTAEAISAVPNGPDQSNVRYLKVGSQSNKRPIHMPIPKRTSSRMISQLAGKSEEDLIASFPATPIESAHSHSLRSSVAPSEAGSMESRRLMSVTKQEESLLAAMRLKKAAMRYNKTHDIRLQTLRNLERGQSRLSQVTDISNQGFVSAQQLALDTESFPESRSTTHKHRRSLSNDDRIFSRASGTTFQTSTSRNQSRLSGLTFQTERSADNVTRLSLSSEASQEYSISPSLLSLSAADRRQSRDTFLSTSPGYKIHARKATGQSHVVALDDLDKVPKRDEIPSQEFIDWPYNGWEARATLGLAH